MLPLKDKWIVITRPIHQANNLRKKLESAGANVILFPLLEIIEPENMLLVKNQLSQLVDYDLAIFVSPNAVEKTFQIVGASAFNSVKVAAIGKKTTSLLEARDIRVDYCPIDPYNSEALLAHPELQASVESKKVVILRGQGGRELLRDSLKSRGAFVDYINVYQRVCPQSDLRVLEKYVNQNKLDMIMISSGESLENLFSFLPDNPWLNKITLLLGSERIKKLATQIIAHRGKLMMAKDPSDETFYQYLLEWNKRS